MSAVEDVFENHMSSKDS